MRVPKLRLAALALVSSLALGGCVDDMYGPGYGGYGGYGPYSSVSIGVGYGGGYGYGDPYWGGGYGLGYGSPFGWYDDFYYPGTGIYVYDSYRRPRMWNDRERWYWMHRNGNWHDRDGDWHRGDGDWHHRNGQAPNANARLTQPNWSGFNRRPAYRPR
ncbi:hypothetical protein [Sphingomonas sp.]|uniref:hypothetical protein n=1 Tax=Sphingomonas sp. TaxID=28214 RepID=UPI0025E8844D|nr:hypothetical protein [Sphingomonas sp.]